jgi:hypothetical protein
MASNVFMVHVFIYLHGSSSDIILVHVHVFNYLSVYGWNYLHGSKLG